MVNGGLIGRTLGWSGSAKSESQPRGGLYFRDFEPGAVFAPAHGRGHAIGQYVVHEHDLEPTNPEHRRAVMQRLNRTGPPRMHSLFTLGLMIGISSNDMTLGATIADLGMMEVRFPTPLFEGDSVHCRTRMLSKRMSRSRPDANGL